MLHLIAYVLHFKTEGEKILYKSMKWFFSVLVNDFKALFWILDINVDKV